MPSASGASCSTPDQLCLGGSLGVFACELLVEVRFGPHEGRLSKSDVEKGRLDGSPAG